MILPANFHIPNEIIRKEQNFLGTSHHSSLKPILLQHFNTGNPHRVCKQKVVEKEFYAAKLILLV